jgi:hypothetical protein
MKVLDRSPRNIQTRAAQRGAALIIGLVLMLVLTVLGISGMNTATLELVMASNSQSQEAAFQAAETGIDLAIGNGVYPTNAQTAFGPAPLGDGSYSARSVMNCVLTSWAPGYSPETALAYHFDVVAVGTGPRNAASTHNQSFYKVGPPATIGC